MGVGVGVESWPDNVGIGVEVWVIYPHRPYVKFDLISKIRDGTNVLLYTNECLNHLSYMYIHYSSEIDSTTIVT